jgi:hypothetical protein
MGAPILVGAGIGALGSAITGGNPLKGALLGGVGGGLTGGATSLLNGGSFLEGAGLNSLGFGSGVTGATSGTSSALVGGTSPASFLTPTEQLGEGLGGMQTAFTPSGSSSIIGSTGEIAPNLNLINTEALKVAAPQTLANETSIFAPAASGGLTPMSTSEYEMLAKAAQTDPSLWDKLKPYVTPSNMIGAANVAAQYQPKPYQMTSSGGGAMKQASFQRPQGNLLDIQLIPTVQRPRFF